MFSGVMPTSYLQGSLETVRFPAWFGLNQRQKNMDRLLIELETHCVLKIMNIDRKEFNLDYLPIFNYLFKKYFEKFNVKSCLELMNTYYFNQDDLQMILNISSYRKMNIELDIKMKNLLIKSLEKQHHRTPFKQININQIKSGMSGAREDDDDYTKIISDDEENLDPDNDIIKQIQSNPKRRKMK
jgi:hypothetical protein